MNKIKFFIVIVGFVSLIGCTSDQSEPKVIPQTGMFKVEILYPNGEDKTFDLNYYENKHMPMVASFLGENLKFYEIDKGISGRTATDKVPFVAIGYFYISDVAQYNKAIEQNIEAILSDIKNYTNIKPVIQISEIKKVNTSKPKR